ncbi:hypothetical protein SDC9_71934 [bioreactor metagenome]|uniref:Uncharacterized protein n=1 Tax=bioreactor metagenome TaxID=1076179 RepID=A0A644YAC6_9ZZZZ
MIVHGRRVAFRVCKNRTPGIHEGDSPSQDSLPPGEILHKTGHPLLRQGNGEKGRLAGKLHSALTDDPVPDHAVEESPADAESTEHHGGHKENYLFLQGQHCRHSSHMRR